MKKLDIKKIKKDDIEKKLKDFQKELFKLKSTSIAGEDSLKKKGKIKSVKRDIARLKTRQNNE